jgi:hypothetical protein
MAYTIVKSNGQVLTTIPDGTINTSSTSLGLPGRNYAGYGQYLDTNFVHMMENFADTTPPANPLQGQLWYNTNANTLYVCPADGTANANAWLALTSTSSGGTTTFGAVTVTGNISSNNATITNGISADTITVRLATVTDLATIANANVTTANIGTTNTTTISAGSQSTNGTLTGVWTANGSGTANSVAGTSMWITGGNLVISGGASLGIRTDNYYYANGTPISFAGTYNNGNVFDYLTGSNAVSRFGGAIAVSSVTTANITTGASGTSGQLTGNWTLSSGSRLNATYADLAERFEADASYDAGTVVELGGDKEITAVQYELSEDVFGVISDTAAYLMNSGAGTNVTHPPVAMTGRVQVKVIGAIKKGDRLVSAGNGIARAAKKGEANAFNTIGRSLANKTDEKIGTILATVAVAR